MSLVVVTPRRCRRRATPYLFTEPDIRAVMSAADELFTPLRAATMRTLVGVLAVTGMRIGEARPDLGQDRLRPVADAGVAPVTAGRVVRS